MPGQKGKRAKGVQMPEQQPKLPQVAQDIVEMPPTADIAQIPATEDIVQMAAEISQIQDGLETPDTAQIEDIVAMASDIQPIKRALGGNRYLELKEWNGSKRVDLRFCKDGTVPTKEGVSLHLDQWKALCNMSDVIDNLLTRVIEKEPVEWRYHIGDDVFVTIKAPFPFVHIRKQFIPTGEWTYRTTKRGVALHFGEWKELKQIIPLLEEREPELRQLVPLYRTDL
jgi:hypothetical protein